MWGRRIVGLAAIGMAAIACASIAGISDAELDPELDPDLCTAYCDAVLKNCQGPFEVYTSRQVCLDYCATLPLGERGDESGNTVGCRLEHALEIEAIGEELVNCPIAGPGGDGVCGTNCEAFCVARRAICDPELPTEACLAECALLADPGGYDTSLQSGATVQCRLYHVSAATIAVDPHCFHAAGNPPCVADLPNP